MRVGNDDDATVAVVASRRAWLRWRRGDAADPYDIRNTGAVERAHGAAAVDDDPNDDDGDARGDGISNPVVAYDCVR